jgi:hypothetical protein
MADFPVFSRPTKLAKRTKKAAWRKATRLSSSLAGNAQIMAPILKKQFMATIKNKYDFAV